jgi:hypothetical protein
MIVSSIQTLLIFSAILGGVFLAFFLGGFFLGKKQHMTECTDECKQKDILKQNRKHPKGKVFSISEAEEEAEHKAQELPHPIN